MDQLEKCVAMIKELIENDELKKGNPIIAECKKILVDDYYHISQLNKENKDKVSIELYVNKYFADKLGFDVVEEREVK